MVFKVVGDSNTLMGSSYYFNRFFIVFLNVNLCFCLEGDSFELRSPHVNLKFILLLNDFEFT